ncbi:Protein required for attachment to host cells [Luteibacter sp. UNC138MFCol5.1]|uniref:host attachment protein n=1 Tax=Luteibacter sp. UNC138MFCol5.1 TaxID=1502774 RepID=UPI0008B49BE1|nr:host attachment protein [Luteibacter sp. UNC138MFCol5.1]SEO94062.1 Protein required for attachment to host cells [Luteibacter sp. UNC138MFCol5.1]
MSHVWILVCDAARARLFEAQDRTHAWNELAGFANPVLRMPPAARGSGRSIPRVHDSRGAARHIVTPRVSIKDHSARLFAHDLAVTLRDACSHRRYARLLLVAPPRFLGTLSAEMGGLSSARVAGTLGKDLVGMTADVLEQHVRMAFPREFADVSKRAIAAG